MGIFTSAGSFLSIITGRTVSVKAAKGEYMPPNHEVFEVADILIQHALETHGSDIAIIAYYGSWAKGTATANSDLDICFIPANDQALALSSTFVIDGRPFDFWPVSWEFAEALASARSHRPWAVSASLIADAKILYARSTADRQRFAGLQARIQDLTSPGQRTTMINNALEAFKEVLFQSGQMRLATASGDEAGFRWASLQLVNGVANSLALANQTYFSKGWGANMAEILDLEIKPDGLAMMIKAILFSERFAEALDQANKLVNEVRDILLVAQQSTAVPATAREQFQGFYYFIVEYKEKTLSASRRGDTAAAYYAAAMLQEQICQLLHRVDAGYFPQPFNHLGEYHGGYHSHGFPDLITIAARGDLESLDAAVEKLDEQMQNWLVNQGLDLQVIKDREALVQFLRRGTVTKN